MSFTAKFEYTKNLAVLCLGNEYLAECVGLASRLSVPLISSDEALKQHDFLFYLSWRRGQLTLLDQQTLKSGGLSVKFDVRHELQKSWPAPKKGPLAQAIGRKTETVIDATCGWGQDSFFIFRMGYQVTCFERSPVMVELLQDGLHRLAQQNWMQQLQLQPPPLKQGNAIELLASLDGVPDCIYLDPMFPPKRKKSALAKKSMTVLRDILGDDNDRALLFEMAMQKTGKRVVVKSPDYAPPLGGASSASFKGKLVRYDVYLK